MWAPNDIADWLAKNPRPSTTVEVEADTAEEAASLAEGEVHVSLCHHCARDVEVGDEWDATFAMGEDGTEAVVEGWRD